MLTVISIKTNYHRLDLALAGTRSVIENLLIGPKTYNIGPTCLPSTFACRPLPSSPDAARAPPSPPDQLTNKFIPTLTPIVNLFTADKLIRIKHLNRDTKNTMVHLLPSFNL